jgi:hypothetical protein
VLGANDRINIAFIGNGMQFETLLQVFKNHKQQKNDVEFVAVCDVGEPRLAYAQKQSDVEKTYRDYREVLRRGCHFCRQPRIKFRPPPAVGHVSTPLIRVR